MKILLYFLFLFNVIAFGQSLEMGPITRNFGIKFEPKVKSNNFIDSSFVFATDTISLPFFDDFSTDKFQNYDADFNAPGLTNQLFYKLLNYNTLNPFPSGTVFSNQQTFKRTFDLVNNTFSDTIFNPIPIKLGDFTSYPIQYQTIDVFPPYYIYDTIGVADVSDTVWLENPTYLQDSSRIFFTTINDPSKLWIDSFAYHNYRFGLNPRSLGVVTFDGLDENGFPYQINTAITNYADRLTSKPIDLSGLNASDSVYFSFLYQPEGLGDIPEQNDSLILEFYAKDLDQWFRVWSINGDTVYPFRVAHLNLSDPKYFKKGFQFRFRNYGSLAGALDHFHVDYVHLRALSNFDDTLFKDFAFVYPINSLLKTYTSVPWDHYKNSNENKMTDSLYVQVHNGSPNPENYQNGSVSFFQNKVLQGSFILQGFTLAEKNINFLPRTFHNSFHDLGSGVEYSKILAGYEQHFGVKANVSAQFPNEPINDSCSFTQDFYNYYSYDDGSAEAAFGPTGTQSRLAIRFDSYEADSLIGINMHFVPSVTDVSNKLFLISVWGDNNGKPGELLYEDDVFFPRNPIYTDGINEFYTYYFKDTIKVAVGTRFYVGWRQLDGNRLNLGLDRNSDHSETIRFSVDGGNTWLSSPFPGTAMLRPVFSTELDQLLGISKNKSQESILVYPNPTSDYIHVALSKNSGDCETEIYDSFGRLISKSHELKIDFSNFDSGIYFLRLPTVSNKLFKVIKQ
jgi:hypothetical protein